MEIRSRLFAATRGGQGSVASRPGPAAPGPLDSQGGAGQHGAASH